MLPISFQTILKARSTQVVLKNTDFSDENLSYISSKKLEKLRTSHGNRVKNAGFSRNSSCHDTPPIKNPGIPVKTAENRRKSNISGTFPQKTQGNQGLKDKIQSKLLKSNEILQQKLANSQPKALNKHSSLPSLLENASKIPKKAVSHDKNPDESSKICPEDEQTHSQECFPSDWDAISEAHWQSLLNSEVFKTFNINPITLIENNPDYFSHLLALCACYRCVCGLCKCKYAESKNVSLRLAPNNQGQTVYQREFFDKTREKLPNPGLNLYNTRDLQDFPGLSRGFNYTTTHQAEFRPFTVDPKKRKTHSYRNSGNPFLSLSTYNSNFVDWKTCGPISEKIPQNLTIIRDLPFKNQQTTYKNDFSTQKIDPTNTYFVRNLQRNRPKIALFNEIPFIAQTHHSQTFKPFEIPKDFSTRNSAKADNLGVLPGKAQDGHFLTMSGHDFLGLQEKNCPAKRKIDAETLKSQIYSKLESMELNYNSRNQEKKGNV